MIWGSLSTSRSFTTSPKTFLLVRSIAGSHSFLHTRVLGRRYGEQSSSLQSELRLELSAWADGTGLGVLVMCLRPVSGLLGPQFTHRVGDDLACVRLLSLLMEFYEHTHVRCVVGSSTHRPGHI